MASSNTTDYAAGAAALRGRLDLRRAAGDSVRAAYSNSNRTDYTRSLRLPNSDTLVAKQDVTRPESVTPSVDGLGLRTFLDAAQRNLAEGLNRGFPLIPGVGDVVDNILTGARKGAFVLPDPIRDPDNPNTVLQLVGGLVGAGAEGFGAERLVARGLVGLAARGGRTGAVALKALDKVGLSPGASLTHRLLGGAATGTAAELGLRVATGHYENLGTAIGLTTLIPVAGGGAVGALRAGGRITTAASRALRETLPAPLTAKIADKLWVPTPTKLFDSIRDSFASARRTFGETFRYEEAMRKFDGLEGDGLTMADELRLLKHTRARFGRAAEEEIQGVLLPMKSLHGGEFAAAYQDFVDLVIFRDMAESAGRGLDTPLDPAEIQQTLAVLQSRARPETLAAADNHRRIVNEMRDDLVARGKIKADPATGKAGFDDYFPNRKIVEDLAAADYDDLAVPRRTLPSGSLKRTGAEAKRGGSTRAAQADYLDVMYRAVRRFHWNRELDRFTDAVVTKYGVPEASLSSQTLKDIDSFGVALHNGSPVKRYQYAPQGFFRTNAIDEAAAKVLDDAKRTMTDLPADQIPKFREVMAVGERPSVVLPAELADRMAKMSEPLLPKWAQKGPVSGFLRATAEWKRNTIFWGLSRFGVFQILGDGMNLLRSRPQAFLQFRNGKLESDLLFALRVQFARYGTPMISSQQVMSMAAGAGLGELGNLATGDDPGATDDIAWALAGAGLGYVRGTSKMVGRRPQPLLARWYSEMDEAGAINTGFVHSEEDLARQILSDKPLPAHYGGRTPIQRAWDTFKTLGTGKVHGDPYNILAARQIAESVELIQTERENWMRAAAYINAVKNGTPPRLAARFSREALVDYGKFTPFEDLTLRRGLLPFYSFYRHNIPNWIRAGIGRDPGGKAKVAFASLVGIASFDIAAQAYNNQFFPEVELSLDPTQRKQFHIVMGDPATGEPLYDKNGKAMIVGFEMPYEQALEVLGLARPGLIMNKFMGMPIRGDESLVGRALALEEFDKLPVPARRVIEQTGDRIVSLLNPIIKVPAEFVTNKNWYTGAPLVSENLFQTKEQYTGFLRHAANTFLRQVREAQAVTRRAMRDDFNPLTNTFGLGLPVKTVDLDRDLQRQFHQAMREAAQETKSRRAPYYRQVDDLIYSRKDLDTPAEDEMVRLGQLLATVPAEDRATLGQYYLTRIGQTDLVRHFESLSMEQRARFLKQQMNTPGGLEAFAYYAAGGRNILQDAAPIPSLGGGLR